MLSLVRPRPLSTLSFTFVILVNASLGTAGGLGANTRTLHLAVKVSLTTINNALRLILRSGCFREEYSADQ
jgi:hypothetical protein